MKLKDLVEKQKIIRKTIEVPPYITELDYKGAYVKGGFYCQRSNIASLEGAPSRVDGNFFCHNTIITSLEGAPEYVGNNFDCSHTHIPSLHNVHKIIKHIGGSLYLSDTTKSSVLGVMYINDLQSVEFVAGHFLKLQNKVTEIINKHLFSNRDIHACQEELLEAGLGEYAKL